MPAFSKVMARRACLAGVLKPFASPFFCWATREHVQRQGFYFHWLPTRQWELLEFREMSFRTVCPSGIATHVQPAPADKPRKLVAQLSTTVLKLGARQPSKPLRSTSQPSRSTAPPYYFSTLAIPTPPATLALRMANDV